MSDFKDKKILRRHFLRGAGYTLALPVLESLTPFAASSAFADTQPINFVSFYWGNGSYVKNNFIFPTGSGGKTWTLPQGLNRLVDHKNDLIIFEGLSAPSLGGGAHSDDSQAFLAGPSTGKNSTLDQLYGKKSNGAFRTIYAQSQRSPKGDEYGALSRVDGSHANPATTSKELFERIFVNGPGGQVNSNDPGAAKLKSMKTKLLDVLLDDVKYYKTKKLGASDQIRLDEYLTSVEEIQRNVTSNIDFGASCHKPGSAASSGDTDPDASGVIEKRVANYIDIIATSMQCGISHSAAVMMWGCSTSNVRAIRDLKNLKVSTNEIETHTASHASGSGHQAATEWNQFQAAQFITRAKATSMANGSSLFDSLLFMWGSTTAEMGHSKKNCPIFLSGKANGSLTPFLGTHYKYPVHFKFVGGGGDFETYYADETPRENVLQAVSDILGLGYSVPFPEASKGRRIKIF